MNLLEKLFRAVILIYLLFTTLVNAQKVDDIKLTNKISIESRVLGEERTVYIYLPESYSGSLNQYPVLYVLDGRSHFLYLSGLVESISRSKHMPEMIVVAIENTDRTRDLTPTKAMYPILSDQPVGGGADRFTEFIDEELIPFVENNYRTKTFRMLAGHSLAGLYVTYVLLNYSDLFDAVFASSPSLHWDEQLVIRQSVKILEKDFNSPKRYYLSLGSKEEKIKGDLEEFVEILKKSESCNFNWEYNVITDADHRTVPYLAFSRAIINMFQGWYYDPAVKGDSLKTIERHYSDLSFKYGFEVEIPEGLMYYLATRALNNDEIEKGIEFIRRMKMAEGYINSMGYEKMNQNNLDAAFALLCLNVELYPNSANVYDSLGEAYMKDGNRDMAIQNYRKSLQLNPENSNALEMLKRLGTD